MPSSTSNQESLPDQSQTSSASPLIGSDSIALHVLSPAPEVAGGRITFPSISTETTIAQLKLRLQNSIGTSPSPDRQRLIYRGRALVDGQMTLKAVFLSELNSGERSHTLHLVLPPSQPVQAQNGSSPHAPPHATSPPDNTLATPDPSQINAEWAEALARTRNVEAAHDAALNARTVLRTQLNMLQQQLAFNNPPAGLPQLPPAVQLPHPQIAVPDAIGVPVLPGFVQVPQIAGLQAMVGQQHAIRADAALRAIQENHQRGQGTHQPVQGEADQDSGPRLGTQNSVATSEGLPPNPSSTTRVHESIGPNGERVRVVVSETVNFSRQGLPVQGGSNLGMPPPTTNALQGAPVILPFAHPGAVPPAFEPPMSPPMTSTTGTETARSETISSSPSAAATAWLLSTPSGPQAMLFAPGHGYFSTAFSAPLSHSVQSNHLARHRHHHHHNHNHNHNNQIGIQNVAPAIPNGAIPPIANTGNAGAAQLGPRPPIHGRAEQGNNNNNNNNENDMFQLIVQRGWLFLRLYIFTFVLSEAGTWRRWFLLAIATAICLMPRHAGVNNLMARIRRHIDDLIPIQAVPGAARQAQPTAGRPEGTSPIEARERGGQPTPEEAAARILQQQNAARNENYIFVRNTFVRVERAVALFLASLVPGVGERHVRAREEARREAERRGESDRVAAESVRVAATPAAASHEAAAGQESSKGIVQYGEDGVPSTPDNRGGSSSSETREERHRNPSDS